MKFVIWAPSFDNNCGGVILLHLLCQRLNELGYEAQVRPGKRRSNWLTLDPRRLVDEVIYFVRGLRKFSTGPFGNRLASRADLGDAIVVYPETVAGNPLSAPHVVRWFLHRPGYHTGKTNYGRDELYFYIAAAFNDPEINPYWENKLVLQWVNPVYSDPGDVTRHGSCYMMRHEPNRVPSHNLQDSVCIDGLSHEEVAQIFKRTERFYSYDPYTFYLWYAAICGCIPIVVPLPGVSKGEWQVTEGDRLGLAYGEEDIEWAIATRDKLLRKLDEKRAAEDEMVKAFAEKCLAWARSR